MMTQDLDRLIFAAETRRIPSRCQRASGSPAPAAVTRQEADCDGGIAMSTESYLDPHPRHLLLRMQAGERLHSARVAEFELQLKPSAFDPLVELGLAGGQRGLQAVADLGPMENGRPAGPRRWPLAGLVRPTWLLRAYPFRSW
jgi:hypothetical protein